ncbi:hypothetical protein TSUD_164330 [Trifolium subterraneum]|uniref:Enoyl-ACP reductase n=1 Tax=Trifolium subterraneum TaxID=3900 RepID=A0A2Z6N0U4_TRISU|nr:hypothetical protein TSUD_164330 [Trifolium subterraneum]
MATTTTVSNISIAMSRPRITSSQKLGPAIVGCRVKVGSCDKLGSVCHVASVKPFQQVSTSCASKFNKFVTKAVSESSSNKQVTGLPIDLRGKRAFIAGVADDNGYGWAIAKSLAEAGAEILALNIFESSLRRGKFDESRKLQDGSLMEITKVYPLDAVYDTPEDVPEDVKANKRYAGASNWTVQEVVESVKKDFGTIDILVHSLANGPEVSKLLSETSRKGYLAALSASSGASLSLTYIASERIIPGYGGGMSSAKAALESDTRVLAFEAGRKKKIRVNTISAEEVGNTAAFLASPLASAITGAVIYVDNGLNAMGVGVDSPIFKELDLPKEQH